jgi:23S rRNA (uracil1939-C5)-methyltransferase
MLELGDDEQLRIKHRQVREALARIGRLADVQVEPVVPAPSALRYRNKMEFSFHPGQDGVPRLGLHEHGTFDRVFDLQTCLLPSELTLEIVRVTRAAAVRQRWTAYDPAAHRGVVRFLVVRHLRHTRECAVTLVAASDAVPGLEDWVRSVAALSPEVRTVTLGLNRSRANIATVQAERTLVGDGRVRERLLGLEFEASIGTFLQTNSDQAEALYAAAVQSAGLGTGDEVLDLYCGTGTLTLMLARAAGRAIGVESVGQSIERARSNAARNGVTNVEFVAGEARAVLRQWARGERPGAPRPAVIVVDPPRAGLHPRVVARVAELAPRGIVYVSCNPATLARDAQDLAGRGYPLRYVRPFDMFPHTAHIECVARFDRADPGRASPREPSVATA